MREVLLRATVLTAMFSWVAASAALPPADAAEESSRQTVEVRAENMQFHPDRFAVVAGREVEVKMRNTGRVSHSFDLPELDIRGETVSAGDTLTLRFTVGEPGEYEFICDVAAHAAAGMRGTMIVRQRQEQ